MLLAGVQDPSGAVRAAVSDAERAICAGPLERGRLGPGADDPHGGHERPALQLAPPHLPPLLSHPEALATELSQEPGAWLSSRILIQL